MDKKQTIDSILKQINADCIVAHHVENDMYIQNFPSRWGGWQVRSPVTWRVFENYAGQASLTAVFFDVLLRARPDEEGAFQFPSTTDWVLNRQANFAFKMDDCNTNAELYHTIHTYVEACGAELASVRPGQVKLNSDDKMLSFDGFKMLSWEYKPDDKECGAQALDPSVKHVWDEAKLTDSQIRNINSWLHGPANLTPEEAAREYIDRVTAHEPETQQDQSPEVEKKINFREFL